MLAVLCFCGFLCGLLLAYVSVFNYADYFLDSIIKAATGSILFEISS